MLQEALHMSSGHMAEEMREVEEELEEDSSLHDTQNPRGTSIPLESAEEGKVGTETAGMGIIRPGSPSTARYSLTANARPTSPKRNGPSIAFPLSGGGSVGPMRGQKRDWIRHFREGGRNALGLMTSPVFAQAFVLTFLGEWGDRSQITTIAMGGAHVSPHIRLQQTARRAVRLPTLTMAEHPGHRIRHHSWARHLHLRRSLGRAISINQDFGQA
jgi:putative Ca2+/H+ antiporter (TMEM165/GDT1 family)